MKNKIRSFLIVLTFVAWPGLAQEQFGGGGGNSLSPASIPEANAGSNAVDYISPWVLTHWAMRGTNVFRADSTVGNDVGGQPSKTISNAVWLASNNFTNSGQQQLVVVDPGQYSDHNLLRPGVSLYFMPGATNFYFQATTNEDGFGIFDDRVCGPGGYQGGVYGYGDFGFLTYTGQVYSSGQKFNTNTLSAITFTNHNSIAEIDGHVFGMSTFLQGQLGSPAVCLVQDGTEVHVNFTAFQELLVPPFEGYQWALWQRTNAGPVFSSPNSTVGVEWQAGNLFCHIQNLATLGTYGIWGFTPQTPSALTNHAQLWYQGDTALTKIYMNNTSQSNDWVTWIDLKNLEFATNASGYGDGFQTDQQNGADYNGNGKHYLKLDKINGGGETICCLNTPPNDFERIWISAQKISATNTFLDVSGNIQLTADVQEFEDNGGIGGKGTPFVPDFCPGAINVENTANVKLRFINATMTNQVGKFFACVSNNASLELSGGTIRCTNAAAIPIIVGDSASHLILRGVTLVASNSLNCVTSEVAANVGCFYVVSTNTLSGNITPYPAGGFVRSPLIQ